jgi:hypothetical protein
MKKIRDILAFERKNLRGLGLLLLSTLIIIIASALAYARVVYEQALNLGNPSGVTAGSNSTASAATSLGLATIVILVVPALLTGLSIFSFRHKLSMRFANTPGRSESSPTGPVSLPTRILDEDTMKIFRDILDPEPEKPATTA